MGALVLATAIRPARAGEPPSAHGVGIASDAAAETRRAVFALVVGVNASPTPDVAPLQYADDDAARYLDLFRALGARAVILSRLDPSTRRLHPQAAAEALPPRHAELRRAVDTLARDIGQARARGVPSTLYVVYAGHGDVDEAGWALTLEDGRLGGTELLSDVVERAGADESHLIVDACHAYMLALPRGPGGAHRPAAGFVELEAASRAGHVGFLLSSSASGESHEWSGFEAGVFSHEVRSGLYGAADADGDGRVTYAEMGAFIARANERVVNDRFRPQVLARPPRDRELLLDLRGRRDQGLRFEGANVGAHYLLEDATGVRLLDFHGSQSTAVQLLRPPGEGPLYLRRVSDGMERTIRRADGLIDLASLPVAAARVRARGAAHQAFGQLFALGFDSSVVAQWTRTEADVEARVNAAHQRRETEAQRARARRMGGIAGLGLGVVAAAGAIGCELSARALYDAAPGDESQRDTVARNQRIDLRNRAALGLGIGAAAAAVTGAVLLFWPSRPATLPGVDVAIAAGGGEVLTRWEF